MSLIKKPYQIESKRTIACMVYGQSGMGKTTLACSAPSPVLFDFDGGVSRIKDEHQVPTVQINTWEDALDAIQEVAYDGDEFKTVIIDTASKMIDAITLHVCGNAAPKIQQWGIINQTFKGFLRNVQRLGKNIVFVAQREVEKNGEETRYVPQFRASNYKDVICDLDVCGYMEMVRDKDRDVRMITFNPTCRNEGKNTAEFAPAYYLPDLSNGQANTFLADRFNEYVQRQTERAERRTETAKAVEAKMGYYSELLGNVQTADELNEIVSDIAKEETIGDLKLRLRTSVSERAKELALTFNKETKKYE